MNSFAVYLISGVSAETTGTVFPCVGMKDFSVQLNSTNFSVQPATGTVNIQIQLEDSAPWFTKFSNAFAGASGLLTQFNGPFSAMRATTSPYTTGSYTVVCRYSNKY